MTTLEIISFNVLETENKKKIVSICLNRAREQRDGKICLNFDFLFKSGEKCRANLLLDVDNKLCIERNVEQLLNLESKEQIDTGILSKIRRGNIEQLQIELLDKNCEGTISSKIFSNL